MWGKMMARHPSNKLTALAVKKQTTPGRYCDGNGLYLVVDPSGAKRWLQRLSIQGKRCDLGLGSTRLVSLDDAREQALINRRVARAGLLSVIMKWALTYPLKTPHLKFIRLTYLFGATKSMPNNGSLPWKTMFFQRLAQNLLAPFNQRTYWRF